MKKRTSSYTPNGEVAFRDKKYIRNFLLSPQGNLQKPARRCTSFSRFVPEVDDDSKVKQIYETILREYFKGVNRVSGRQLANIFRLDSCRLGNLYVL
ncbi:hypothetical protein CHS0354_013882 [Potamilus streckersoni]|uniref:Uncharacterized protein n=1 Tax=Potamilus streckersoni TaxID=2493646 RepID=A0AAE0SFP6_9BIVA|nr:hypothetical protein CHS0354_013882 [Potamilus streckersoni]